MVASAPELEMINSNFYNAGHEIAEVYSIYDFFDIVQDN